MLNYWKLFCFLRWESIHELRTVFWSCGILPIPWKWGNIFAQSSICFIARPSWRNLCTTSFNCINRIPLRFKHHFLLPNLSEYLDCPCLIGRAYEFSLDCRKHTNHPFYYKIFLDWCCEWYFQIGIRRCRSKQKVE